MEITTEAFVAAATIIAGAFSLVGLILSKDLKVTESRQQWIEALRNDISNYLSSITTLYKLAEATLDSYAPRRDEFDEKMCSSFRSKYKDDYWKLNETNNRIVLRLNPKETNHFKLMQDIRKNTSIFYDKECKRNDINESSKLIEEILGDSQLILKKEWERVKEGEPIFKYARYILFGLAIVFLFFGFYRICNKSFS